MPVLSAANFACPTMARKRQLASHRPYPILPRGITINGDIIQPMTIPPSTAQSIEQNLCPCLFTSGKHHAHLLDGFTPAFQNLEQRLLALAPKTDIEATASQPQI